MTKLLRDAIAQVERLPEGEQDAAAVAMLDYLAHRRSLRVSDEVLAEIRRRRANRNRKLVAREEARAPPGELVAVPPAHAASARGGAGLYRAP